MNRIGLGMLLCLSSAAALAQTTTTCGIMPGGLISCRTPQGPPPVQQYVPAPQQQFQPNYAPPPNQYGGTPATNFLQGFMHARQQAQQRAEQQQFDQERLEQMRLQNQLLQQQLQQQLEMQRQQAQIQQQQTEEQNHQGSVQQQPMSAADRQTVDEEQRQLQQDVANGH